MSYASMSSSSCAGSNTKDFHPRRPVKPRSAVLVTWQHCAPSAAHWLMTSRIR